MADGIRVGALISGGGTNLQAIIDACEGGRIDGKMVFVGSDNPKAHGLTRSRKHHIPDFVVDYDQIIRTFKKKPDMGRLPAGFNMAEALSKQSLFPADTPRQTVGLFIASRVLAETELLRAMADHPFDLLVLAGFMRIFTPFFIDQVNGGAPLPRIMNIHPALLPAFPGVDGYGDTFRYGCKVGGCTVHFVDYGEDSGPIIGQRAFPIEPGDTLESIKQKGLEQEWKLYPACIQLFAEKRLKINRDSKRRVVEIMRVP
jgi:phosphoribosylglycinamide formyltransferase-1